MGIFPFDTVSRPTLGLTQPPIQLVAGALSLGVKRQGREADHSPPSSIEVKECLELHLHTQYVFMAWCLVKHRDDFILLLFIIFIFIIVIIIIISGRNDYLTRQRV
jgi:hypothetical protein